MSTIALYSQNPTENDSLFDTIRFYEATDDEGAGETLVAEIDIDSSTSDTLTPGYTRFIFGNGDTDKYYSSSWYSSTTSTETDRSDWMKGGQDRWDTLFMVAMNDQGSEVWTQEDRVWMKEQAIEALYPEFYRTVVDTSLTVANNSSVRQRVYTLPSNIFQIREVGIGDPDSMAHSFLRVLNDNWTFERNQIRFYNMAGIPDGQTIRVVGNRKFESSGEVPVRLDPMILLHMRSSAYTRLADDFPRFEKWARIQKGTRVSFENLRVHAREFERRFNEEKRRIADTPGSSEII